MFKIIFCRYHVTSQKGPGEGIAGAFSVPSEF
jgi:hypothetical protein